MSKIGKTRVLSILAQLALLLTPIQLSVGVDPEKASSESDKVVVAFQAEDAIGSFKDETASFDERVMWRSNAMTEDKPQTLWLKDDGDTVVFHICLPRKTEAQVKEVRFSSDGWAKNSTVSVNDVKIGQFTTIDNSNFGHNWNKFNMTTGPFDVVDLKEGWNFIVVTLEHSMDSDPYGIEIDQLTVHFGEDFSNEELKKCAIDYPQTKETAGTGTTLRPNRRIIKTTSSPNITTIRPGGRILKTTSMPSNPTYGPESTSTQSNPTYGSESTSSQSNPTYVPKSTSTQSNSTYGPESISTQSNSTYGPESTSTQSNPTYIPVSTLIPSNPTYVPESTSTQSNPTYAPESISTQSNSTYGPESISTQCNSTYVSESTSTQSNPAHVQESTPTQSNPTYVPESTFSALASGDSFSSSSKSSSSEASTYPAYYSRNNSTDVKSTQTSTITAGYNRKYNKDSTSDGFSQEDTYLTENPTGLTGLGNTQRNTDITQKSTSSAIISSKDNIFTTQISTVSTDFRRKGNRYNTHVRVNTTHPSSYTSEDYYNTTERSTVPSSYAISEDSAEITPTHTGPTSISHTIENTPITPTLTSSETGFEDSSYDTTLSKLPEISFSTSSFYSSQDQQGRDFTDGTSHRPILPGDYMDEGNTGITSTHRSSIVLSYTHGDATGITSASKPKRQDVYTRNETPNTGTTVATTYVPGKDSYEITTHVTPTRRSSFPDTYTRKDNTNITPTANNTASGTYSQDNNSNIIPNTRTAASYSSTGIGDNTDFVSIPSSPDNRIASTPFSADEQFTFTCPVPGTYTVVKNSYYSCYQSNYRLDVYGSETPSYFLNVAFPELFWRRRRSVDQTTTDLSRPGTAQKALLTVGNTDPNAIPKICSKMSKLKTLSDMNSFSNIVQLNHSLPAKIDPNSLPSFFLRFNLTSSTAAIKQLREASFVFVLISSCRQSQLEVDVEVVNLSNRQTIIKRRETVIQQDRDLPGRLSINIPISVQSMEIRLNFSKNTDPFVLNALALDLSYATSPVQTGLNQEDTIPHSARWVEADSKRKVLFHKDGYVLEAVNKPGAKQMKVKTSSDGKSKEVAASRLILSDINSMQPRVVFDQTSRCYFFTNSDPSKQTSFVMGPRDPNLDSLNSDLEEVEVSSDGDRSVSMKLTSKYGTRSLAFALTTTMTTVSISDMNESSRSPLCSVLLPCTGLKLDTEAFIKADDTEGVETTDAWRTITGNTIDFTRPVTCGSSCVGNAHSSFGHVSNVAGDVP